MSWSMGCFPKQKSKHHCLTSLFGSHLPPPAQLAGAFLSLRKSSSRGLLCHLGIRLHGCARGAPHVRRHPAARHGGTRSSPVLGELFCCLFPSHHRGQPQGPAPTTGVSRAILPSVPPPGRVFPRGNREQAAFSKKIWQITGCGLHVHAKIRTHVRNENATAWRQSPRWGWSGGKSPEFGRFQGPVHFAWRS